MGQVENLADVTVIVVGLGFAGLTAAIELRRKGAKVIVFESTNTISEQGQSERVIRCLKMLMLS